MKVDKKMIRGILSAVAVAEHELGALCNEYIDSIDPVYEKFIKERFSGLFVEGEHDKSGV